MEEELLVPIIPYVLKSGKHEGKCIEDFIFNNSDYLFHLRNREYGRENTLKKYLDFVFYAGCQIETKTVCPFCKKNHVKHFLLREGQLASRLTCCENPACKKELKSLHTGYDLRTFRLSTLGEFKEINQRKKAEIFFKAIYGFSGGVKSKTIFNALKKAVEEEDFEPLYFSPSKKKKKSCIQLLLF